MQKIIQTCSFFQKAYIKINYPKMLCPNQIILHVPLDVHVLVLIVGGRYICMKKIYCGKVVYEP